jgi:hypothetical protein
MRVLSITHFIISHHPPTRLIKLKDTKQLFYNHKHAKNTKKYLSHTQTVQANTVILHNPAFTTTTHQTHRTKNGLLFVKVFGRKQRSPSGTAGQLKELARLQQKCYEEVDFEHGGWQG